MRCSRRCRPGSDPAAVAAVAGAHLCATGTSGPRRASGGPHGHPKLRMRRSVWERAWLAAAAVRSCRGDGSSFARLVCCCKRQSVSRRCRGPSRRPCLCKASCTSNTPPAGFRWMGRKHPSMECPPARPSMAGPSRGRGSAAPIPRSACASRSSRGPRLTAHPAPARTRGHPWPRPAAPARTLAALRCSADLRGPRVYEPAFHGWSSELADCFASNARLGSRAKR